MNLKKNIARLATAAMVVSMMGVSPAAFAADSAGVKLTLERAQLSQTGSNVLTIATLAGTTGSLVIDFQANGANNMSVTSVTAAGSGTGCAGTPSVVRTDADTITVGDLGSCTTLSLTFVGASPAAAGSYLLALSGATTGAATYATVTNDTITVTATVDPSISFDVGASTTGEDVCDSAFVSQYYDVNFGHLLPGTIASSDTNANVAGAIVRHICTRLSTNATSGAVVTAKNANGANGLVSVSKPADKIPSAAGLIAPGTPKYGMCVTANGGHIAGGEPASNLPVTTGSAFSTGCTSAAATIVAFTGAAQNVWSVPGVTNNAFYQMNLQVSISGTQPAHNDYTDSIVFVATATF